METNQKQTVQFWPGTAINWIEFVIKILVIIGGIGGVYQYCENKQADRVKESMKFLENFNTDALFNAQMKMQKVWIDNKETVGELKEINFNSKKAWEETKAYLISELIQNYNQEEDIGLIVGFFENLQTCIENRICDKHVSQEFFEQYASKFFGWYRSYFLKMRNDYGISDYACKLQSFAQQEPCKLNASKVSDKNIGICGFF